MIELQSIDKSFGKTQVLRDISLTMEEGSFTSLLGPSGCGKSTMLRIIAGLEHPTKGIIKIRGKDVTELTAAERNIAMVFQSYALYPHMTVKQNIMLPLSMRNMTRLERMPFLGNLFGSANAKQAENAQKAQEIAEMLEIDALLERKPAELSGGQMQRVAVGRALVRDPAAFLLDEPLSNLDAKLRTQMRGEIVDLHKRTGRTFIYVTHDQAEAMSMSDRIAVIMHGGIIQIATPTELFNKPATKEVAAFVGDRPINLLSVALDPMTGDMAQPFQNYRVQGSNLPQQITVGIRPETLTLTEQGGLHGTVTRIEYLGHEAVVDVALDTEHVVKITADTHLFMPDVGQQVAMTVNTAAAHFFDEENGHRLEVDLTDKGAGL